MTATIGACLLTELVETYRPADLCRMDPFWEADSLDAFSTELFGLPVAQLVGLPAARLVEDWRDAAYTATLQRIAARLPLLAATR